MEEGNEEYNDTHRAFLQAFLARQTLTFEDARPLLARIQSAQNPDRTVLENDIDLEEFERYMGSANLALSPLDFEIRSQLHQKTASRIYALVNVSSDALTQMATIHSPDEIAFVKRVLDAMFITHNSRRAEVMAISGMEAMRLSKVSRGIEGEAQAKAQDITQSQAEYMLSSLVAEGWLEQSQHGFYSLAPRALMELRSWLPETYNDRDEMQDDDDDDNDDDSAGGIHQKIKTCQGCKEIITSGQRCPVLSCEGRLHDHCTRTMFSAQRGRKQCPLCETPWQDPLFVGERAARGSRRSTTDTNGR